MHIKCTVRLKFVVVCLKYVEHKPLNYISTRFLIKILLVQRVQYIIYRGHLDIAIGMGPRRGT